MGMSVGSSRGFSAVVSQPLNQSPPSPKPAAQSSSNDAAALAILAAGVGQKVDQQA